MSNVYSYITFIRPIIQDSLSEFDQHYFGVNIVFGFYRELFQPGLIYADNDQDHRVQIKKADLTLQILKTGGGIMSNIKCKSCGKVLTKQIRICPNCGANPVKGTQITLSSEQLNLIWKYLRTRFIIGAVFWGVVISLVFGVGLNWVYSAASDSTEKLIQKQIAEEFEKPEIKEIISNTSVSIAEQQIDEAIAPNIEKAEQDIQSILERTQKLARETQEQLDLVERIILLEDAARFGSRKAYVSLRNIASTQGAFAEMAKRRTAVIENSLLSYRYVQPRQFGLTILQNNERIDLNSLSTTELFEGLLSPSLPKEHIPAIMSYIVEKPKSEICRSAGELLKQSDSLVACAATCGILIRVLGEKAPFLDFEKWLKICENE